MKNEIDFVITWVNQNDIKWRKQKKNYSPKKKDLSNNKIRYRNWETLRYWFRGVNKFADWVRKIHFVTWGHVPNWLNINHSKINIVRHEDFIPKKYLPTFNSRVIELNFHRIKNLSEKFVYFNDDMFLVNDVSKKDFFKEDKPCDSFILDLTIPHLDTYNYTLFNNIAIINKYFKKSEVFRSNFFKLINIKYGRKILKTLLTLPWKKITGVENHHLSIAYNKSNFFKVWDKEKEKLQETCTHRFRTQNDLNHFLVRYWQLFNGDFYPSKNIGEYLNISKENSLIKKSLLNNRNKIVCINDSKIKKGTFKSKKESIHKIFDEILAEKSNYEL